MRVRTLLLVGWRIKSRSVVLVLYNWNGEIGVMYSCLAHFVLILSNLVLHISVSLQAFKGV